MNRIRLILPALLVTLTAVGQRLEPFSAGDKVVFLGNSITEGGHYHSFIWLYYMTRFPDRPLIIHNAGIGGDRVVEMTKRLDSDVLARSPTKLFISFGMNDSGYGEYHAQDPVDFGTRIVAESYKNYQRLESRLKSLSGLDVTLLGSTPYDENVFKEDVKPYIGKHWAMKEIVAYQKRSAQQNGWSFFDFNEPMAALNTRLQAGDSTHTLSGFDRIHPDNDGHMIMAYLFLKAQGFSGKPVAKIGIDAARGVVSLADNCEITDIESNRNGVSFSYLARSLPYPLDTVPLMGEYKMRQSDAIALVPFMDEMNQEIITASGLRPGNYELSIDGVSIGSWTSEELAVGINLAAHSMTPQYQQALAVMHLNEARWRLERELRSYTWIQYYFFEKKGMLYADDYAALQALDGAIPNDKWLTGRREQYALLRHPQVREAFQEQLDLLISKIYQINKPVIRKININQL